jgi:RNA polymerase sigma factor (sigma-70 family)
MVNDPINQVIRHLRRAALLGEDGEVTDGHLLERFLAHREGAAFEALVRRHGPMVMGTCRRVLRNAHDAEDAFQATFLVLVRKAASLLSRTTVGNWLYGVAFHTALKARAAAGKRRAKERQASAMRTHESPPGDSWHDWLPLLDEEVNRLPDKYRAPVVLCDLEGKSRKEAARLLGCKEGTLSGWLARARAMLARRLARRGLAVQGAALAAALSPSAASAAVPPALLAATVQAATLVAAGKGLAAGLVPAQVVGLTEGVLKALLLTRLKFPAIALLVIAAAGLGADRFVYPTRGAEPASAGQEFPFPAQRRGPPEPRGPLGPPQPDRPARAKTQPPDAAGDREIARPDAADPGRVEPDVPAGEPPIPPPGGPEHLAAIHENLRRAHARFPHLAVIHGQRWQNHTGHPHR